MKNKMKNKTTGIDEAYQVTVDDVVDGRLWRGPRHTPQGDAWFFLNDGRHTDTIVRRPPRLHPKLGDWLFWCEDGDTPDPIDFTLKWSHSVDEVSRLMIILNAEAYRACAGCHTSVRPWQVHHDGNSVSLMFLGYSVWNSETDRDDECSVPLERVNKFMEVLKALAKGSK